LHEGIQSALSLQRLKHHNPMLLYQPQQQGKACRLSVRLGTSRVYSKEKRVGEQRKRALAGKSDRRDHEDGEAENAALRNRAQACD
jgi:hypothetical protein